MKIRLATIADMNAILPVYDIARNTMRANGNMTQWTNGYPSPEQLMADIRSGNSYVCTNGNDEIVATFYFSTSGEPTYSYIEGGCWLNEEPYGVVHRLAASGVVKGVGAYCIGWCFEQFPNIRIDTHRDNKIMQGILNKLDYKYCGIIYLANGDERLAYQKCLSAG